MVFLIDEYLKERFDESLEALQAQSLSLFRYQTDRPTLELQLSTESDITPSLSLNSNNLSALIFQSQPERLAEDSALAMGGKDSAAQMTASVSFNKEPLGLLVAQSETPEAFQADQVAQHLEALSAQIAALIVQPAPEFAVVLDKRIAALSRTRPYYDWCGVYKLVKDTLFLASFRGEPSPHEVIPKGAGICGAAVTENRSLNIPDVGADERYLSCDARTKSEVVIPIQNDEGNPIGEIDIDSHSPSAFTDEDVKELEIAARDLAPILSALV